MITDQVIREIYKKYKKPCKNEADLQLDYFIDLLSENHNLKVDKMEILVEDMEPFNPFRRFLKRSIFTVIEFDKMVAFVFRSHILFFEKDSNQVHVHIRPEEPKSLFGRIFGK